MFLKEMTWDIHLRLEKRLAVKDRFATVERYRTHLSHLLAFQSAAEKQWGGLLQQVLGDYPARVKAPLLKQDIESLGAAMPAPCATSCGSNCATFCVRLPDAADPVAALGGFYVLEGATLGGQHLLPVVERKLGLSASHGAAYLASYGSDVQPMWRKFCAAVEARCATPQTRDLAGAMARDTFLALEACLCGDAI